MDVEGIQIDELKPMSGKKKQMIVGIFAVLLLLVIVFVAMSLSKPEPLSAYFTDSKIRPGASTELVVTFRNLGSKDLHDVRFFVSPESKDIMVSNPEHTEPTIGAGAYRKMVFNVSVNKTLTQGTYRISVEVDAGEDKYEKNVYLEIAE